VGAVLRREWGPVSELQFGQATTDRTVRIGDKDTAKTLYDRFVTELWFVCSAFVLEGKVRGFDPDRDEVLVKQLASRRYEDGPKNQLSIESKVDMHKRLGYSPDRADAFCMLVEMMRRRGAVLQPTDGPRIHQGAEEFTRRQSDLVADEQSFRYAPSSESNDDMMIHFDMA
jgi:hypothetical protein